MIVIYLSKADMLARFGSPYFGYTQFIGLAPTVFICSDLPKRVQVSVLAHETQHVNDNAFHDDRVWHWEFRAWVTQFNADWLGTLQTIWLSVTDKDRLKLYWKRITGGF